MKKFLLKNWINTIKMKVIIREKDSGISLETLQRLLTEAHVVNETNGLKYATAHQTLEKLSQKLKGSTTFVAFAGKQLVGTMTIQIRGIAHWYHKGEVGLIKLVAVHPDFAGEHIASRLLRKCMDFAEYNHVSVLVTDSAERNVALRRLVCKYGFVQVDCCKYKENNFISSVYAYWKNGCRYNKIELILRYHFKKARLVIKGICSKNL